MSTGRDNTLSEMGSDIDSSALGASWSTSGTHSNLCESALWKNYRCFFELHLLTGERS